MDSYPAHPAMQFWRRRAYKHGLAAGRRNPTLPIDGPRGRWLKRHADTDLERCLTDWEDGWNDASAYL